MENNWIIIKTHDDLPKETYDENHAIYLCITNGGKTVIARWHGHEHSIGWKNISMWKDEFEPIAYKQIFIPEKILETIKHTRGKKADYLSGLRKE